MNVFVYGTLLSGQGNNHLLRDSTKLGDVTVSGLEMHTMGGFPACVVRYDKYSSVTGEVWEVDDETFARLDRLEGYPHFYDRIEINTPLGEAWVYINEEARSLPVVESGDWKKHNEWRIKR